MLKPLLTRSPSPVCSDIHIFKMKFMRSSSTFCSDIKILKMQLMPSPRRFVPKSKDSRCSSCAHLLWPVRAWKHSRCTSCRHLNSACSHIQILKMQCAHLRWSVLTCNYPKCKSHARLLRSALASTCSKWAHALFCLFRSPNTPDATRARFFGLCWHATTQDAAHALTFPGLCNSGAQLLRSVRARKYFPVCSEIQILKMQFRRSTSSVSSDINMLQHAVDALTFFGLLWHPHAQDAGHELTFFGPSWHSKTQDAIHGHTVCSGFAIITWKNVQKIGETSQHQATKPVNLQVWSCSKVLLVDPMFWNPNVQRWVNSELTIFSLFWHPNAQDAVHAFNFFGLFWHQNAPTCSSCARLLRSALTSKYTRCSSCAHLLRPVMKSKYSSTRCLLRSVLASKYSRWCACAYLCRPVLPSKHIQDTPHAHLLRSDLTSKYPRRNSCAHLPWVCSGPGMPLLLPLTPLLLWLPLLLLLLLLQRALPLLRAVIPKPFCLRCCGGYASRGASLQASFRAKQGNLISSQTKKEKCSQWPRARASTDDSQASASAKQRASFFSAPGARVYFSL